MDFKFNVTVKATNQREAEEKVRALLILAQLASGQELKQVADKAAKNPGIIKTALKYI